jgi:c-di-GMP-binding flagellar brake protein YcgR
MAEKPKAEILAVTEEELLSSLAQPSLAPENRRSSPRIDARLEVEVALSWEQLRSVYTDNISKGGLLFSIEPPVKIPAEIKLSLRLPGGEALELTGEVRHVKPNSAGRCDVGVQFVHLDPAVEAELIRLLRTLE